jgi:Lhr-like helicase
MPEVLIITPESLHINWSKRVMQKFSSLKIIAVDEWHELGSKRGVQSGAGVESDSRESGVRSHKPYSIN